MKTFIDPFSGEELPESVLGIDNSSLRSEGVPKGVCPKCEGKGKLQGPLPNNGICYACGGTGKITSSDLSRAYKHPLADTPSMSWLDKVTGIEE